MNVHEFVEYELAATQSDVGEFFRKAWEEIYGRPCRSNQVVIDTEHYRKAKVVPSYVWSFFDRVRQQNWVLPERATKSSRWEDTWNHQNYRLVDDSPLLVAQKGADGVWRAL